MAAAAPLACAVVFAAPRRRFCARHTEGRRGDGRAPRPSPRRRRDGRRRADIAHGAPGVGQTLFSQGLGREPGEFQRAVTSYFDSFGRLDPLDLIGAPAFCLGFAADAAARALEFFDDAVKSIVDSRKAKLNLAAKRRAIS